MRQATINVRNAFITGSEFKSGHDAVNVYGNKVEMSYRGNMIARKMGNKLFITNAGWKTNTTKERLNGLPNVHIKQVKGKWYLNGNEWDGGMIEVK